METLILTDADAGKTIRTTIPAEIVVRLPENPTTGFRWDVDDIDPGTPGLVESTSESGTSGQAGAARTRVMRFELHAPGELHLQLKEWRPWEGDASVRQRYRVEITGCETT